MRTFTIFIISLFTFYSSRSAVNPLELGRASNIYTIINPNQNQVYADPQTNMVVFIHQQDVTIWGGGSAENGKFRYDISTDSGNTFSDDIGVLNNIYSRAARFPQITGYNPNNSDVATHTQLVYWGMTLDPSGNPAGHVAGNGATATANPIANFNENYLFIDQNTYKPGGLCEGKPGEFWIVEADHDDTKFIDFISFTQGVYNMNSGEMDWSVPVTPRPNHQSTPAKIMEPGPDLAFAPDGLNGWAVFGGEVTGTTTGVYSPIFYKTTDGGTNWSDEIPVDLNLRDAITDRLDDTYPNPVNQYGMVGGFDITVDAMGNPHLLTVVGHVDNFTEQRGDYARMLIDLTSNDGGQTWEILYIAPVLATKGSFGFPAVEMNNYCQIARSTDGNYIFYSWVDQIIPDGNGEFTYNDLFNPNLRSAGYRITDAYRTCISKVTDNDFIWDGRALFPAVAPVVLGDTNNGFKLPTVVGEMIQNDPTQPCRFWYFGNEVTYFKNGFMPFADYDPDTYLLEDAECNSGTALAVADINLQVQTPDKQILLTWESSDTPVNRFQIQRKTTGDFQTIQELSAQPHTNRYQFTDTNVRPDTDYYYRIMYQNTNRSTIFSNVQHIRLSNKQLTIIPNPAQNDVEITWSNPNKTATLLSLHNKMGQLVFYQPLGSEVNNFQLDCSNLSTGVYFLQIKNGRDTRMERLIVH